MTIDWEGGGPAPVIPTRATNSSQSEPPSHPDPGHQVIPTEVEGSQHPDSAPIQARDVIAFIGWQRE